MQRTVATVVEVGRRLLDEEGPDAVTHLRIGELTGIARTTIYRHFPDREALLEAVLADGGDPAAEEEAPPDRFDTGSLVGDLDAFLDAVRRRSGRGRETQRLPHLLSHAERHGRFAELRDRRMDRLLTSLETILERARERGELDHRVEPPDAAAELLGPLFFRRFFLGQQLRPAQLRSARDDFLLVHGVEPPDATA
ncbi:MAG: TetR/AcrR family transcriptional regulator [Actinomycetota bacterium]